MFNKLKQLKNLKFQANQIKSQLSEETAEIRKSGVKILINGNQEIIYCKIENQGLLNLEKSQELESAIKDAVNEAIKEAQKLMAKKMMANGDFNIPGM